MRKVIFTFTAEYPDEVTTAQIRDAAMAAAVQITEPEFGPNPYKVETKIDDPKIGEEYDAACERAATNQGLDPVMEALRAADIKYNLEQTGGFCMVVTVDVWDTVWRAEGERVGTIAITADGGYLIGYYPGNMWREGPHEDAELTTVPTPQAVAQHIISTYF
jgi:hypothetical protein